MKQSRIDGLDLPAVASSGTGSANPAPAFNIDVARSVRLHPVLALAVAAVTFLAIVGYALTRTPMYKAESLTYVEPLASKVMDDGSPGAYDPSRYESYLQQQIQTATRADILEQAIAKLPPGTWQHPGEDIHAAAARLAESLKVQRVGQSYQLSISLIAPNPAAAADIVNAATNTYLEAGRKDENVQSDGRLQLLTEERDRIQTQIDADHAEQTTLGSALGVADTSAGTANPYDMQLAGVRTELVAAREAHAIAAAQLESVSANNLQGATGLTSVADDAISSDPGIASLKASLNQRRAILNSQMAGMTPSNPVYKQDQQEIAELDHSLDTRMSQLRVAAEKRVEDKLRLDLQRTGDVEAKLNGQLAQQTALAHSAAPKLQRAAELTADVNRLQAQYTNIDAAMRGLKLETTGPGTAHLAVAASAPTTPEPSRRTLLLVAALPLALIFGALAAVIAKKRDPRVYTEGDVEAEIGFLPIGVTPASEEVSGAAIEEYLLRMAAALERAYRVGGARSFVFTAASRSTGVSPFVNAMQRKLGELGFCAIAIGAGQALATEEPIGEPVSPDSGIVVPAQPGRQEGFAAAKLERLKRKYDFLLLDAQPLLHSAEAEYAVRSTDATILVIESGVTTTLELRQAGLLLQRLNVTGVGAVLQHLHLKVGNSEFRSSIHVLDKKTREEEASHETLAEVPVLEQRLQEISRRIVFLEAPLEPAAEPALESVADPALQSAAEQELAPPPATPLQAEPHVEASESPAPEPSVFEPVTPEPVALHADPHEPEGLQHHDPTPGPAPVPQSHIDEPPSFLSDEPASATDQSQPEPARRDFRLWEEVIMQPESLHNIPPAQPESIPAPEPEVQTTAPWQSETLLSTPPELLRGHSPLLEADNFVEDHPVAPKPTRQFAAWQPEPTELYEPVLDRNHLPPEPLEGEELDAFLKTFKEVPPPSGKTPIYAAPAPQAPSPQPPAPFDLNWSASNRESIRGFEPPLHALTPQGSEAPEPAQRPSSMWNLESPRSGPVTFPRQPAAYTQPDPAPAAPEKPTSHALQDRILMLRDTLLGNKTRVEEPIQPELEPAVFQPAPFRLAEPRPADPLPVAARPVEPRSFEPAAFEPAEPKPAEPKSAEPKQSALRRSFFWLRKHAAEPEPEEQPVKLKHQKGADPILEAAIARVLASPRRPPQPPAAVSGSAMVFAETTPETWGPEALTISQVEDAPSIFLDSKSVPIAAFAAPAPGPVATKPAPVEPAPIAVLAPAPASPAVVFTLEPQPQPSAIAPPAPVAADPIPAPQVSAPARSERALAAARLAASMAAALPPVEEPNNLLTSENVPEWLASAHADRIRRVITNIPTPERKVIPAPAPVAAEPEPSADFTVNTFDAYSSSLENAFANLSTVTAPAKQAVPEPPPSDEPAPSWVDSLVAWTPTSDAVEPEPVAAPRVAPEPPASFPASLLAPVEIEAVHYEPEPVIALPVAIPAAPVAVEPIPAPIPQTAAWTAVTAPAAELPADEPAVPREGHPSGSFQSVFATSSNLDRKIVAAPLPPAPLPAEAISAAPAPAFVWPSTVQQDLAAASFHAAPASAVRELPLPPSVTGPRPSTPLVGATTFRPAPQNGYTNGNNGHSNGSSSSHVAVTTSTLRPYESPIVRPVSPEVRKPVASAVATPDAATAEAATPRRWHMLSRFDPAVVAPELLGIATPRDRFVPDREAKDRAAG